MPHRDREDAETGADDGAEAEEGVEQRQDRLAGLLLDRGALDVHHHVERAVAEAEQSSRPDVTTTRED